MYRTRIATFTTERGETIDLLGPLFAAAPDMLAALHAAQDALALADTFIPLDGGQADETARGAAEMITAAIARATGREG